MARIEKKYLAGPGSVLVRLKFSSRTGTAILFSFPFRCCGYFFKFPPKTNVNRILHIHNLINATSKLYAPNRQLPSDGNRTRYGHTRPGCMFCLFALPENYVRTNKVINKSKLTLQSLFGSVSERV